MTVISKIIKHIITIPSKLFSKTSVFSLILNSRINKTSAVLSGCKIYDSKIDKYSYVGRNSTVINSQIGKFTSIANNCNIGLASHNLNWLSTSPVFYKGKNCLGVNFASIEHENYKRTIIGNDVWIGANVLIKSGVTIGDGAVIGAGSIVTKNIPAYAIYAGNPAKLIRYRYDEEYIEKLLETKWWDFSERKIKSLDSNMNDIEKIVCSLEKNKVLIQSVYAAPYRVGVFEQMSQRNDIDVFFEQLEGHNRNKHFFQNNNNLNSYNLEKKDDLLVYKKRLSNIRQYDCVFVYDYSSLLSIKLMIKCIINKVPYCINCDGYFLPNKKNIVFYIKKFIKSFFIRRASRLLANGESAKNYFLIHGAKEEKIDIHYFSSLFKNDIQKDVFINKEKLKAELGFDSNRLYLSIGSFDYRKGFELIIEAAHKSKDYKSQYVFVGGGDKLLEYKDMCQKYNLNNFKFIDFLGKEDLLKYYDAADAFILPTREDIWGLVINEAMSRGLPVISTDRCNAALEMISDDNGIIVKSDSVDELSRAINTFNSYNNEQLLKMGSQSLKIVSKYNIEDIALNHCETIRKVVRK